MYSSVTKSVSVLRIYCHIIIHFIVIDIPVSQIFPCWLDIKHFPWKKKKIIEMWHQVQNKNVVSLTSGMTFGQCINLLCLKTNVAHTL